MLKTKAITADVPETSVFTKPDGLKWREESLYGENNLLMYSSLNKRVYCSNSTGRFILQLCDGKHTLYDIVENMANMYDIEKKIIREDTLDFIKFLINNGLVKMGQ